MTSRQIMLLCAALVVVVATALLSAALFGPPAAGAIGSIAQAPTNLEEEREEAASDGKPDPFYGQATDAEKAGAEDGTLTYDELLKAAEDPKLERARFVPLVGSVELFFEDGSTAKSGFIASDSKLIERFSRAGVEVEVESYERSSSGGVSPLGIMFLLLAAFLIAAFIGHRVRMRRMGHDGQGGMGGIRSDVEVGKDGVPDVGFNDVAGCDEAVEEVKEFRTFLQYPERFERTGAKMPSGILLHGPPGTGKTLLAKALAGESGVPFFSASGTDFVERYVGVGASRVRELFSKARKSEAGAVVFIDEIDAIGRKRSESAEGNADAERESTLNQLLVELDGFSSREQIVVVAATNRMELLDPALLRPGRLSRQVMVPLPSRDGRRRILELYTRSKPLADDVDLDALADFTAGSSGAELAEMVNEAAIMAARANRAVITQDDLTEGHLRVLAGPERRSSMATEDEQRIIAYHEAGHVLCAELCSNHEKAQRATVKPRGQAGGLAIYGQLDRALHSVDYVQEQLICALGGRAAEQVVFGTVSSGAANDLQKVNALARQAIEELGLSRRTGQLITRQSGREVGASERTKAIIDQEVEALVADAYADAIAMLEAHRDQLESLAQALLEKQDLNRAEILQALGRVAPRRPSGKRLGPQAAPALDTEQVPRRAAGRRARKVIRQVRPALAAVRAAVNRRRARQMASSE